MSRLIAMSTFAVLSLALVARADIKYEYVADSKDVKVEPGKPASVKIYLQETVTGDSKSLLGPGLFTSGFKLTRKSGDATVEFVRNPAFGGPGNPINIDGNKTQGGLLLGVAYKAPGVKAAKDKKGAPPSNPKGVTKIWIATAKIAAGEASESVFEVESYSNNGSLTMDDLFPLDISKKKGEKAQQNSKSVVPEDYVGANSGERFTLTVRKAEKK